MKCMIEPGRLKSIPKCTFENIVDALVFEHTWDNTVGQLIYVCMLEHQEEVQIKT